MHMFCDAAVANPNFLTPIRRSSTPLESGGMARINFSCDLPCAILDVQAHCTGLL